MLHSSEVINSIIKTLIKLKIKIILDPVMVAKGGAKLIDKKAIKLLKFKLIKKAFLITPNIPETEVLTNTKIKNISDMRNAGRILLNLGAKNILLKGGHGNSKVVTDILINKRELIIFKIEDKDQKYSWNWMCFV